MACKFAKSESSWLQRVGILQEKVYKTCITGACFVHLSCNILHTMLPTGFRFGEFAGHSWGWINYGVSLSKNSVVARVWWAFQVSQGSVETLFRWGRKRLYDFAANLFRKLCTEFRRNCQSFVRDITKTFWSLFSWTQCIFMPAENITSVVH